MQPQLADLQELGVDVYVFVLGSRKESEQFFDAYPLEATLVHDPDGQLAAKFSVSAIPATFFVDKQGRLSAGLVGWQTDSYEQTILPALRALLKEE